jgi:hypothetical protein
LGKILCKLDKDIIVEIIDKDGIGRDGKRSKVVIHELFEVRFLGILEYLIEENGDELFVEFFVSDFDLVDKIEKLVFVGTIKDVSLKQEVFQGLISDINDAVLRMFRHAKNSRQKVMINFSISLINSLLDLFGCLLNQ